MSLSDSLVISEWNDTLPIFKVEDVCGLSEALMGDSEGRRRPSWIWTMDMGVVGDGADQAGNKGMYPLILQAIPFAGALSKCNSSQG